MKKQADHLHKYYEFRNISTGEAQEAAAIERACFPPNEACSEKMMTERAAKAPEYFFVAVDRKTGRLAGFLNGLATDEPSFRDEFFTDAELHDPHGRNVLLLGLAVLPQYRGQGLAREIMTRYLQIMEKKEKHTVLLTCLDSRVAMYKKMGFLDEGPANSTWGGEAWHQMSYKLER